MAPYATAPAAEKEETKATTEERARTVKLEELPEWLRLASEGPTGPPAAPKREGGVRPARAPLSESLLEMSSTRPGWRTIDFVASVFLHGLLLTGLLLAPLYFTETIDLRQFVQTLLVAPPPPPPPPPPAEAIVKVRAVARTRVFTMAGRLLAPTVIPRQIAIIKEEALPPDLGVSGSVVGGVPGGIPGGQIGGVLGAILSGAGRTNLPPLPSAPMPKTPVRVGGRVKMPRIIANPPPVYPSLARQAKIEGDVVIEAVIDVSGSVAEMRVVSGHPLLIPAALEALAKWKYEPTYLNDQPVPVQLFVTIRFRLTS